ncbi:hypothetical protein [Aquimarina sp. I32.4]|uniref:hypothetical protein n=1 Tax=Aquimarina sp. I32.4 TaxID=2053903 RepID=UPI000CDECCA7|nr:hypothetical protein [Aquimarina sp. I32.4]
MDKLIYLTKRILILGVLILGLSSCEQNQGNKKYIKEIDELKQKIDELKEQIGHVNSDKPSNIIDVKFAAQLYHNYDTTRVKWTDNHIRRQSKNKNFNATRSLYYDLDSLYNYLAYIKRISKEANVETSGLRFYFGAYSNDYVRNDSKAYAYRQTIFIAPTTPKQVEKEIIHFGYTLSDDFKVELLKDKIGTHSRDHSKSGGSIQKASLFNFNLNTNMYGGNSTIANELTGSPPRGNEQ